MSLQEKLSACLQQAVEKHEAAGVSLLILKDGKELCHVREGYADIETGKALRRDSIFRLYSQSKPVTAAAAMILLHNHPSGDPTPSREDIAVTDRLVKAGKVMDIPVLDHVVLGRETFTSFKDKGLIH